MHTLSVNPVDRAHCVLSGNTVFEAATPAAQFVNAFTLRHPKGKKKQKQNEREFKTILKENHSFPHLTHYVCTPHTVYSLKLRCKKRYFLFFFPKDVVGICLICNDFIQFKQHLILHVFKCLWYFLRDRIIAFSPLVSPPYNIPMSL